MDKNENIYFLQFANWKVPSGINLWFWKLITSGLELGVENINCNVNFKKKNQAI